MLFTRIGLIVSLVLLFAQPFIPAPEAAEDRTGTIRVALDSSPSMRQLGLDDQPIVEHAIREAGSLPLAFPASSQYELFPGNSKKLSASEFRNAVDQIQISGQSSTLTTLIKRSQQSGMQGPLFLFSDFQRSSFSAQALEAIDSSASVFIVPLARQGSANVFVDSVWLDDAFIRTGVDIGLRIRLRNGGNQEAENCQTKLFIGQRQAATLRVTVPAQQSVTSQVRIRLSEKQNQACRIEIEDAPVDFDNSYFFTLQPATQVQVVEVASEPLLRQLYANEPLFAYQQVQPQAADYSKVANANLILLREIADPSVGLRESVRRAVQQGATLVIVPSAATQGRGSYNQMFRGLGLGSVQWQPIMKGSPVLQEVAMPSAQSPFFRDVFSGVNQRAGMPKAAPILRWTRSSTEVMRMRDGEGFLAGYSSGAGTVYLFSAPFSSDYSDFSQHPLFVPVLYKLAMQSYQQEQQPAYRLNQQSVAVRLASVPKSEGVEQVYRLMQDSLTFIPTQRLQGNTLRLDIPQGLRQPGFYTLEKGGRTVTTLAFNFDKRESDLRTYSVAELKQLIGPNRPNIHIYETGQGQTVAARYKANQVGVPLWRYCLWAALLFLFVEGILLRVKRGSMPSKTAVAA